MFLTVIINDYLHTSERTHTTTNDVFTPYAELAESLLFCILHKHKM